MESDCTVSENLVFSDFDETIIDIQSYKISSKLSNYLKTHAQIVSLVIVTSRGWDGLKPYTQKLHLNLPQIVENGAKIIDPKTEKILFENNLQNLQVQQIKKLAEKYKSRLDFSAGLKSYYTLQQLDLVEGIGRISLNIKKPLFKALLADLKKIKGISVFHGYILDDQEEVLIDVTKKNVTKLEGIKKWLEIYKNIESNIYVAGNGYPDLPAFKIKKYYPNVVTVAVKNAVNELKCKADIIIRPPEEKGFYQFLSSNFTLRNESVNGTERLNNYMYSNIEKFRANVTQMVSTLLQTPQYLYSFLKKSN